MTLTGLTSRGAAALLSGAAALALLGSSGIASAGDYLPSEADRIAVMRQAASVWKVEVQRVQGGYSLGSGVVVAADQVVTNCHVTRDARVIHLVRGGQRWPVDGQAVDVEHDLCLLRVPKLQAPKVTLGRSSDLQPGQDVLALGYSAGLDLQFSDGQVMAVHRLDGAQVIQSSNAFTSGASGGALLDRQLKLVGILTFRLRGGAQHYFSTPVEWVQALRDHGPGFEPVQPIAAESLAYWQQREPPAQPDFLRAAVLEREQRWGELEALAKAWRGNDAKDPEPWYLQGLALEGLQRWPESQHALEHALALQPRSQLTLLRLGLVHAEQGQLAPAREFRLQLEGVNAEFAEQLERAIAGPVAGKP